MGSGYENMVGHRGQRVPGRNRMADERPRRRDTPCRVRALDPLDWGDKTDGLGTAVGV